MTGEFGGSCKTYSRAMATKNSSPTMRRTTGKLAFSVSPKPTTTFVSINRESFCARFAIGTDQSARNRPPWIKDRGSKFVLAFRKVLQGALPRHCSADTDLRQTWDMVLHVEGYARIPRCTTLLQNCRRLSTPPGGRTPKRRIADEKAARECIWPRLEQRIERCASVFGKRMGGAVISIFWRARTSSFVAASPSRSKCGKCG